MLCMYAVNVDKCVFMYTKRESEDTDKTNPKIRRNNEKEEKNTGTEDVESLSRPQTSQNLWTGLC